MTTTTAPTKVKVSAKPLLDSSAFANANAWVLLKDGKPAGKVFWTRSSSGAVKCAIILHGAVAKAIYGFEPEQPSERFSSLVIGSAFGGGYDKQTAAFNDCLDRNGVASQADESAGADDYLTNLGFTIVRVF